MLGLRLGLWLAAVDGGRGQQPPQPPLPGDLRGAVEIGIPWRGFLPIPTGSVPVLARAIVARMYGASPF